MQLTEDGVKDAVVVQSAGLLLEHTSQLQKVCLLQPVGVPVKQWMRDILRNL